MNRKDFYFGLKLIATAVAANVGVELLMEGNLSSLFSWRFTIVVLTICTAVVFFRHFFKKLQKQDN